MKKWIVTLSLLIVLAACGPAPAPTAAPPETRPTPTSDPALRTTTPDTGRQGNQVGYPGPSPTASPFPEGYPAPPAAAAPANPYPAITPESGTVWILRPLGEQCEDTNTYKYRNQQAARADLTAVGITVYQVETVNLMVCEACGCPTSAHYRAEIAAADLPRAVNLGWREE